MKSQGKSSEEILSHIESHLFGVEADPFLSELSRAFLAMVLAETIEQTGRQPKLNIHCGDGLNDPVDSLEAFDLILSNPPYRKMRKDEVLPLRPEYGSIIEGQPNLYSVFIKRAMGLAKKNGRIVLLTPMSFLSGKSFSKLRKSLINDGSVVRLDQIHDKTGVFLGAEQDAVITVWDKCDSATKTRVHTLTLEGTASVAGEINLPKSGTPWIIPRDGADAELMNVFCDDRFYTLSTYGYSPRMGSIVIHRDKRKRFANEEEAQYGTNLLPLVLTCSPVLVPA